MHVWELRGVELPYWFFTKNCSYELLRLLDVATAPPETSERFRGPVLPIDTVRAVTSQPGRVRDVRRRASPEARLVSRLRRLPRTDRRRAEAVATGDLASDDPSLATLTPVRHAGILDAAYELLRYRYLAGRVSEAESRPRSHGVLLARSRVRVGEVDPQRESPDERVVRPDHGHATSLLGVGAGWRDDEPFVEVRLRPALHDSLDDDAGYPPHMQIRILDARLRVYPDDERAWLHELTLLGLESLRPTSRVVQPWAWSFETGLATRRVLDDGSLDDAAIWRTQAGVGLAWDPSPFVLAYGLADLHLDVGPDLDDSVSTGPGGRVGVFVGPRSAPWTVHAFARVTEFVLGERTTWARGGLAWRVTTSRNTALVAEAVGHHLHGRDWVEGTLRAHLYF